MPDIQTILTQIFARAMVAAFGDAHAHVDPLIRTSADPKFGDYQANVAMGLAKTLRKKPRDVATEIVHHLALSGVCARVEIAGPGFINLHLADSYLDQALGTLVADERLGVKTAGEPRTVVVDYGGPNVAKELHIGHLRSTVIGDAIARVLAFLGHDVIGQNHLGDWGTQFGMLIEWLMENGYESLEPGRAAEHGIKDLDSFYKAAASKFASDAAFAERARRRVVLLQGGDERTRRMWQWLYNESKRHFDPLYRRLDVRLGEQDYCPESFYNPMLEAVVKALEQSGQLVVSRGAKVVFPEGFTDRDNEPLPLIVQKTDGGFLYATTDLAALRYRVQELRASRIVYVTDSRQSQRFAMIFQAVRQAGWADGSTLLEHVPFGTILGQDRKPLRAREGAAVKLTEVMDEAVRRAAAIIDRKNPDLPAEQRGEIAQAVGIGALKYADLASDRIKDYVFDFQRMLALEGNTAPYLQNAFVRIRSIFRKGQTNASALEGCAIAIGDPAERAVAVKLLHLPAVVESVSETLEPHRLCNYLYELASLFHRFYEQCPVLGATDQSTRESRLLLSDLVARALQLGLDLLGIQVVEQM